MHTRIIIYIIIILIILVVLAVIMTARKSSSFNLSLMSMINQGIGVKYNDIIKKYDIIDKKKPIYVIYHIATIGRWKEIVEEQMNDLKESGLYDICEGIWYGCNCKECPETLRTFFASYSKVKPLSNALIPDQKTYENGTINAMLDFLRDRDPGYVLYIHSKGVTATHASQEDWRKYMMHWNVKKHKICTDILSRGFNTAGVCYINNPFCAFYAGNFWWARSEYLMKKSKIKDVSNRQQAEWFLLRNTTTGKNVCLYPKTFLISYIHFYDIEENDEYPMVIF